MIRKWLILSILLLCSAAAATVCISEADWSPDATDGDGAGGIHLKSVTNNRLMASQEADWHDAPGRAFVLNAAPGDLIISVSVQFSAQTTAYPGSSLQYNLKLSGANLGDVYLTRGSTHYDATSTQWSTTEYMVNVADLLSGAYQQLGASTPAPLLIRDESTTVQLRLKNFNEITRVRDSVIKILYLKKGHFTIDLNSPQDGV